MADGGQVERFVVVSACGEHRAIVQSRCLGLTGTDIHTYIHNIQTGDDDTSRLLALPFSSAIICKRHNKMAAVQHVSGFSRVLSRCSVLEHSLQLSSLPAKESFWRLEIVKFKPRNVWF